MKRDRLPTLPLRLRLVGAMLLSVVAVGCGPTTPEDVIDREVFIETYVDLRTAALDTDSLRLSETDRAEILAEHGVTGEDLVRFAEVHGGDLEFMRDVWNEVELRLDRVPDPDDPDESGP